MSMSDPAGRVSLDDLGSDLFSFAEFKPTARNNLISKIPAGMDADDLLALSWRVSRGEHTVDRQGEETAFLIRDQDGEPIAIGRDNLLIAKLRPNNNTNSTKPLAVTYVGPDRNHLFWTDDGRVPPRIRLFAHMPWYKVLREAAGLAMDEPWGFAEGDYSVLRSYITYTFWRAALQEKVYVNETEGLAALCTGLATPTYDNIYLCFKPNDKPWPKWQYSGVCVSGRQGLGKRLNRCFDSLPPRATFIERVEDLVYDSNRGID